MSWVTISLRKMQLKQRISNLELRLMKLSQREQSLADNASYAQRTLGMQQNLYTSLYNMGGAAMMGGITNQIGTQNQADLYIALNNFQQSQMMGSMIMNSIFQSYKQAMDEQINQVAQQIELEKQQLETQLKAARAEEESISKAMDDDIKKSAVQLV